ncbi:ABC transporter substrate-binding protein [Brevibacillus fulvus]|uniref:Iron complex transport system substrate-binding protein n=1 Tax=Brevibacillus fulvus TaxID=1125967 RepID=A0A938Y5W9_9BACL|nr:iron-siderophore ABC transporter substrate-binding protein [Brevibacillus fulvus]MBM7592137.1 iron complex transport system substrate-binding protein [Brevibacillus fulvus]
MRKRTYIRPNGMGSMLAFLLALCLLVTGCGTGQNQASEQTGSSSAGETAQAEQSQSYVVKHAMGETTINGTPKRVVVLTNQGVETLLALGVKPVGAVSAWNSDTFYDHVKAQMEGVTVVGDETQPNVEAIAALQPDLILGMKFRHEKIYQQLSAIAPTVFCEEPRGDWKENFKLYAEAVNKKAEGEKVLADWDKKVAEVKQKAGDKLQTKISLVRFMPGKVRIYYKDTFAGVILNELGFARPDSQNKEDFAAEVTKERIPEMDGDMLFYFVYETGDNKASALEQEWTNDSLWKNLQVVKNNKAFKVNDVIWNTSGGVLAANQMLDELSQFIDKM